MTVDPRYRHYAKVARPGPVLLADSIELKWYDIAVADAGVPAEISARARAVVAASEIGLDADLGFVILHRCGESFYFLLIQVWRGANEVWEAVYAKDGEDADFAPFAAANPGAGTPLRPTFCVWELGVVAAEAAAWTRYLSSPRADTDLAEWRAFAFSGAV